MCLVKIFYISCFLCSCIQGLKSLQYLCFICHKYLSCSSRKDIYLQWSRFFFHVSQFLSHWRVYPYTNQLYFVEIFFINRETDCLFLSTAAHSKQMTKEPWRAYAWLWQWMLHKHFFYCCEMWLLTSLHFSQYTQRLIQLLMLFESWNIFAYHMETGGKTWNICFYKKALREYTNSSGGILEILIGLWKKSFTGEKKALSFSSDF